MRQLRLLAFMVMILPVHDCAAASGTSDVMPCGEHGAPGTRHAESGKQAAHYPTRTGGHHALSDWLASWRTARRTGRPLSDFPLIAGIGASPPTRQVK